MKACRLVGFLVACAAAGCGSPASPTPAQPVSPPAAVPATVDLTGSWSGIASDSQGPAVVAWQLTQTGSSVSGTVHTTATNPNDGSCSSCHRNKSGNVTGTINGSALTLTMFFAAGADGDPTPACSATLNASASSISSSNVIASYSGSDTCEGAFADGMMTMKK